MKNKIICLGVILILFLTFISTSLADKEYKRYIVKIPGSPDCEITEDEYHDFVNAIYKSNDDENVPDLIDILAESEFYPDELSYENISIILGKNDDGSFRTNTFPHIRPGRVYNNLGPHFILCISLAGQTVASHFGREIPLAGDITKFIEIFNIEDPLIEKLVQNITIFTYLHYTDVLFLIGSPLNIYCSVGIIPSWNELTLFNGPFFGAYVAYFGSGIYIYDKADVEKPILDILFGFCAVYSIVQILEMCDT